MKLSAIVALTTLGSVALVSADKSFEPKHKSTNGTNGTDSGKPHKMIKTKANFGKTAGKMEICPTGDCTKGQAIRLSMARLEEFDTSGKQVNNKAENFNKADFEWTPLVESEVNGTTIYTTAYNSVLNVGPGGKSGKVEFNLTASIYGDNGTAMNGEQVIQVPAGGVKFTISMANWPFKDPANVLRFGVELSSQGKDGNKKDKSGVKKAKKNETEKIERVDLGEGMFMDSPEVAVIDGIDKTIKSLINASTSGDLEFDWEFPAFTKTLYYDPVIGSTDADAKPVATTDTTGSGSKATTAPTPAPTSSASTVAMSTAAVMTVGGYLLSFLF